MLALHAQVVFACGVAGMHKQYTEASKPLVQETIWTGRAVHWSYCGQEIANSSTPWFCLP